MVFGILKVLRIKVSYFVWKLGVLKVSTRTSKKSVYCKFISP